MNDRPRRLALLPMLAFAVLFSAMPLSLTGLWDSGMAMAQDDDDGGDDDRDDDDGAGRDDDGPAARTDRDRKAAPTKRRAATPAPRAPRKPVVREVKAFAPEIVTAGLSETDLATLLGEGFRVVEAFPLPGRGSVGRRLAPPADLTLETARDRVRLLPSGTDADFNHYYRPDQDVLPASAPAAAVLPCRHGNCRSFDLVGWPSAADLARACPATSQIGVIDTGVNAAHDTLTGARVEVVRLSSAESEPSRAVHGTAVVSALAGQPGTRVEGMLPGAPYVVSDIFAVEDGEERADVAALMRGLDLMDQRGIRVVNLSLTGPANTALEVLVRRLVDERGVVLVAAVGNGGPTRPVAWPAAYDGVIGVTALDSRGRIYRSAQRGPGVDLAAPGVGLLLATSVSGAREKTGTSFAVPFVTAAAALVLSREPLLTPAEVEARLVAGAQDAGAPGRDDIYGHGLLQAGVLCR